MYQTGYLYSISNLSNKHGDVLSLYSYLRRFLNSVRAIVRAIAGLKKSSRVATRDSISLVNIRVISFGYLYVFFEVISRSQRVVQNQDLTVCH